MVNTNRDTTYYDSCCYPRDILCNADCLYQSFLKSKVGSDWKPHVQEFEMNWLYELSKIQEELKNKTFKFSHSNDFEINERGKRRVIHGECIRDRIVKHNLCDNILNKNLLKYLIYDNGASIQNKGVSFARKRIMAHLQKFYSKYKSNDGYILLIDYSKYYDNIIHSILLEEFNRYIPNYEDISWLLSDIMRLNRIDVSYMNDEEYSKCMEIPFDSLKYSQIDKILLNKTKYMDKHMNIGDQVSQIAGIVYPIPIDNYIKIVKGIKFYARYMDDSYIMHQDKEYLKDLLCEIKDISSLLGITINQNKTRICKLSDYWRYLQIQYSLTESGRIIKKINPKRIVSMRRKMKKLPSKLNKYEYTNWYNSWFNGYKKYMSKLQKQNLNNLFEEEIKKCIR